MDVPSHGRSTKVGGRWVVKGRLQGIDGPVGGLGTFTACTLLWPMVFGISGVVDVQRRSIGQQELVARGRWRPWALVILGCS